MPGLLDIIEDVAADPAVDSSVEKLVGGLFGHLKDLFATGNMAAVEQALNEGVQNKDQLVAAVTANTQPPNPGSTADETQSGDPSGDGEHAA